jgi:hypothetical protein
MLFITYVLNIDLLFIFKPGPQPEADQPLAEKPGATPGAYKLTACLSAKALTETKSDGGATPHKFCCAKFK